MKRNYLLMTALAVSIAGSAIAHDRHHRDERLFAVLEPTHEVPALSSTASGSFTATLDEDEQTITYELTYQNLEAAPLQAHIHLGQRGVNGGISVFLCGNPPNVPPATAPTPPACPAAPATVTGKLTAADIIGPAAQGIAPTTATTNEFGELVRALRSGVTYANVHSVKYPGGEIRGQVKVIDGRH
jgi:hypothetical protein